MPLPAEVTEELNENELNRYADMSDSEIIQWAEEDGMEDWIVMDDEGGLANREELLKVLLGKEAEYDEDDYDDYEDDMFGPDEFDPAGGRGLSSHMESVAEQKLRSVIRNIIKEEVEEAL